MPASPRIVAHLIVGARAEPYLASVLDAIADVCSHVVVNDNSAMTPGPNDAILSASAAAVADRLTIVRSAFTGFADARNACIDATPNPQRNGWVLFVDADEVHGPELGAMAALLAAPREGADAVDGYSRPA